MGWLSEFCTFLETVDVSLKGGGEGAGCESASSFKAPLDKRLNMFRLLCTDGEGGGLGCKTPDSLGWNIDKFGCCSKTLDITVVDCSPLLLVAKLFRALVILDHIS